MWRALALGLNDGEEPYNIDDCEALYSVKKWITSIEDSLNNENNEIFAKVNDLQSVSYLKWGKPRFQIPEFEKINKYAYFDYQRNKVYLRTNKNVKRAINREKNIAHKLTKSIKY